MFREYLPAAQRAALMLPGLGLLIALGCSSDDGLGKRYQVSGQVTYKGEPVEKAVINFVPEETGKQSASGQVEKGAYSLTTLTPGDGALPGKYKVTVDARAINQSEAEAIAKKQSAKSGLTGKGEVGVYSMVPQDIQAKLLKQAKSGIPGKYQITATTDLNAEVKESSNTINFELKD